MSTITENIELDPVEKKQPNHQLSSSTFRYSYFYPPYQGDEGPY